MTSEIHIPGLDVGPTMPSYGNTSAKIAFVGYAEPYQKNPYRNPFTGQEDVLLSQCMHSAGIIKTDCYITSTTNIEELKAIRANVIVAVGDAALTKLTGKKLITKQRGSILESSLLPGKKVIPIIHPSPVLRQYLWRWPLTFDLRRIKAQSMFPEIRRPQRDLKIFPSFNDAMAYLTYCKENQPHGVVYFDTEIMNQEISHVSMAVTPSSAISVDFGPGRFTEFEEIELWKLIASILEDPKIDKAGQNILGFDIPMIARKNNIIVKGCIQDHMIKHHWTYPDFPKGLDFQCSIYTEEPYYKDEGKAWKTGQFDDHNFALYSAKDAAIGLECNIECDKQMERAGTSRAYAITADCAEIFSYMSLRGIKADQKSLQETKVLVQKKMTDTLAELHKICGYALNPGSSKQCIEYFYMKKGIKPYFGKTGTMTTDDKAMTRIAAKGYREARLIQDYRGYKKLDSTYLDIAFDSDSRIRCSINPAGTSSGRISTGQTIFGTGANLQNLPKEFKQFLVADEGMLLIEIDKVQAEWIVTAYRSGDANMIEVAEKHLDAHVKTAQMMFPGMSIDLIMKDHELIGNEIDEATVLKLRQDNIPQILRFNPIKVMSCRQIAKKCNHGLNYDMGYRTFALTANIPEAISKVMVERYHQGYPGIRQWHQRIREQLQRDRTLVNNFGRVRKFLDRWGDTLHKAAIAHLPQSDVADTLQIGLAGIQRMQGGVMRWVDPLIQVHDSFLFQYPLDRLQDLPTVLRLMCAELEPVMSIGGRNFVIPTDMKIGFDWKNMKACAIVQDDEEMHMNLQRVIASMKPKSASDIVDDLLKEVYNEVDDTNTSNGSESGTLSAMDS